MSESTRNFLVGMFVVASLGSLGVLMVWFGETPSWINTSDWELKIRGVRDLRGVGEGSPVKLNGVEIGRVDRLDFKDRGRPDKGVLIIARIRKEYSIPTGAYAKVYGATLGIGTGLINILIDESAGESMLPKKGASIRGVMTSMIDEIITPSMVASFQKTVDSIGEVASAAVPVAKNLEVLLEQRRMKDVDDDPGSIANITTVVERIDALVANLNKVLGDVDVQEDVRHVVTDVRKAAEDLRATISYWKDRSVVLADDLDGAMGRTEAKLDDAFKQLDAFLQDLTRASTSLARLMHDVEEGKGTAGLLARDERLYESAVLAIRRLNEVLDNMAIITGRIRDDGYIRFNLDSPIGPIPAKTIETPGGSKADRERAGG